MPGRMSYPSIPDSAGFDPNGDIVDVYAFYDSKIDATVATASALPASGNWTGRSFMAVDTGLSYRWTGSAWRVQPSLDTHTESVLTANQSIAVGSSGEVAVIWPAPTSGYSTWWSSSSPTRITPNIPGKYRVTATITFAGNAAGRRGASIWKNAAPYSFLAQVATQAGETIYGGNDVVALNGSGDYIDIRLFQDAGGPLDILPARRGTRIRVELVG